MEYKPEFDDLFNFDTQEETPKERRRSARHVRKDIKASIAPLISVFGKPFDVELLNISACGASIATKNRFPLSKKYIMLSLQPKGGTQVNISAQIVHQDTSLINKYGIRFDQRNEALEKYLNNNKESEED